MAVLCGPAGNKFVFGNENKLVAAWWPLPMRKLFGRCLVTIRGDEAKWTRKMLSYLGILVLMLSRLAMLPPWTSSPVAISSFIGKIYGCGNCGSRRDVFVSVWTPLIIKGLFGSL
ncbi:putative cytochrome P450 superfamily [Helianthus debilis subsp. tardiflorus]